MKLIIAIFLSVFAITLAIRVPPSWPKKQINNKFRTPVGSEIGFNTRPHVVPTSKHRKINSGRKYVAYNMRHPNLKNQEQKSDFKASAPANGWKPVTPYFLDNSFPHQSRQQIFIKNYRDNKTHEPSSGRETIRETYIHKEKPISVYEAPLNVSTGPIYPGLGQWAKKGVTHRPYINNHRYTKSQTNLNEQSEEKNEHNLEDREVFEQNKRLFDKTQQNFNNKLRVFPQKHKLGKYLPESVEEQAEESEEQEFIPRQIYSQVRRSEVQLHEPPLAEEPRLSEVIKDSKIQTVYTEEGYEDIEYDHAGHEKHAEESEGDSEFSKETEKEKRQKAQDSDAANSQHRSIKANRLIKSEETKTSSLKNQNDETAAMEIASQIKILAAPVNGTKTQKYVKIFPVVYRYDKVTTEASVKRIKRFTNDFLKVSVNTDFIDRINHNLAKPPTRNDFKVKYPYYNDPNINPNSPLRYAENLDNIPKKINDDFTFYNEAERVECEEVAGNVDPVPQRIKGADSNPDDMEDSTDVEELVQGPRLRNLGDKIDCFKLKYFGKNPLDSPIFKEELIEPVRNIFQDFKSTGKRGVDKNAKLNEIKNDEKNEKLGINIFEDVIEQLRKPVLVSTTEVVPTVETVSLIEDTAENQTEPASVSIITTPKYTIDLKPKHIYHQIELLEYLPLYEELLENVTTNFRQSKSFEEVTTMSQIVEEKPESQALRKVHRKRRPRPRPRLRPFYNIFDINRYLPARPFADSNKHQSSTITPKRDLLSEVHYKHEIKPSEQLNVFADVINNIKNSSRDPLQIAASSNSFVQFNSFDDYFQVTPQLEVTSKFQTPITTTRKPTRGSIKYSSYRNKEDLYEDMFNKDKLKYENLELFKVGQEKNLLSSSITTTTEKYKDNKVSASDNTDVEESQQVVGEVIGLIPPGQYKYKTIYNPKIIRFDKHQSYEDAKLKLLDAAPNTKSSEAANINNFHVVGMKPPSLKQKVYIYSDFKHVPNVKTKHIYLRRSKRNAQKPAYSEVVRNRNKPIDVEDDIEVLVEDDDDYVPHRPKNYHYDEKTGKIVYDKIDEEEVTEEYVEYVEVTEAPLPKPTRKIVVKPVKFANFTGPSYVDFVKQLRNNSKYETILDPTITVKGKEVTTTTTTINSVVTNPPEFLSILSKVKQNGGYESIEDITTTVPTSEGVVVEEEDDRSLQNSRGGEPTNFQIFDITEYLPKVKTYTPKTSIDYSKYQTIERPSATMKLNLSSRYNSEEASIDDVNTRRVQIVLEDKSSKAVGEVNPDVSESKHEDSQANITTTTSTTQRSNIPKRRRGSRRPNQRTTTLSTINGKSELRRQHDKPRTTYPRRIRTRIKQTTQLPELDTEETTKILRRRHQKSEDVSTVTTVTETSNTTMSSIKPRKVEDVQVFQEFDDIKRHGGNYKKESDIKEQQNVKRLTDIVVKPSSYYSDPKLPKSVNQLKEVEVEEIDSVENIGEEGEYAENTDNDYSETEHKLEQAATKKPFYIKDPDKRLYYYASV